MPIKKALNYGTEPGYLAIWPTPDKLHGGKKVYADLAEAKQQADYDAAFLNQYRYVVPVEDKGYAVLGYADLWVYFGDPMKDEIIYTVESRCTRL